VGIGATNLAFTFVGLWLIDRLGRRTLLFIGSFGYIASLGLCAWAFFHWAPQFKVASTAWELANIAEKLENPDTPNREAVEKEYAKAKAAVSEAALEWPVKAINKVVIYDGPGLRPSEVKLLAREIVKEAAEGSGSGGLMVLLCIFAFIASHAIGQGAVIWVFISEIFPDRFRAMGQALGSFTHWIFAALLTTFFPLMISAFAPGWVFSLFAGMMVLQLIWVRFMMPETKGVPLEEMEKKLGIAG
jgi:MFS family permease